MKKSKLLIVVAQYYLNDEALRECLKFLKKLILSENIVERTVIINMRDLPIVAFENSDSSSKFPFLDISA